MTNRKISENTRYVFAGAGPMKSIRTSSLLFALLSLLLFAGCAQDMGEINRVQPNAFKKDLLQGEWFIRSTVVDSPATGAYTFIGAMDPMERGVFEIQEDTLYFYRTYEFAEDAGVVGFRSDKDVPLCRDFDSSVDDEITVQDLEWCNPDVSEAQLKAGLNQAALRKLVTRTIEVCGEQRTVPVVVYRGAPVAAWAISSHFDIQKEYNATTGEKTNVTSENTSDRYWADREYMRVDFSANQVPVAYNAGVNSNSSFTIYEGEASADGLGIRIEDAFGNASDDAETVAYIDFTTHHVLEGLTTYYEGIGMIPYCWYYPWYTGGVYECVSEQIAMRTSLLRVDKAYKGGKSDYVSLNYDDRHMNRFGYFRTERHSYNCNYGLTESGATRQANRHRIWEEYIVGEDGHLDYEAMTPRPIVYYMNKNFPRDLVQSSLELAQGWAGPFDATVEARTGKVWDFPMFILCENSNAEARAASGTKACYADSPEAYCQEYCTDMDRAHENGDLRYNFLHAVTEPLQAGLYGYGPSSADPLTGEIISAGAYNYVAPMKIGAHTAIDAIELLAGVKDWREVEFADAISEANQVKRLKSNGEPPFYTLDQAKELASGMMDADVRFRLEVNGPTQTDQDFARQRLAALHDAPELEAIMGGDYLRLLFKDPRVGSGIALSEDEQKEYSLASFKHHGGYLERMDYYRGQMEKNLYLSEFADGAILGLANEYKTKYDDAVCKLVTELPLGPCQLDDDCYKYISGSVDGSLTCGADNYCAFPSCSTEADCTGAGLVCNGGTGFCEFPAAATADDENCSTRSVIDSLAQEIRRVDLTSPNAVYLPKALWWPTKDNRVFQTQEAIKQRIQELRDTFEAELWAQIYKGVAEHEVGHTLGLRHNFEGSTDAMNYFPEYWDARGQTVGGTWTPIGGPFGDETLAQGGSNMRQMQGSTVMDYGAKFNARFEGVGHYDHAAIKYAYGQVVEQFTDAPDYSGVWNYMNDPSDQDPANSPLFLQDRDPVERLFRRVHYTEIPSIFGGDASKIQDRQDVALEDLAVGEDCSTDASICGEGQYCEHYFHGDFCTDNGAMVPYRFCSDEQVGYSPTCDVWDEGADTYEIVRNAFSDYENYWPFWGFMRDDLKFNPQNYSWRVYRTFKQGQRHFQFWVYEMARNNHEDWWQNTFGVPYEEDLNGGLSGSLGAAISFNTMAQVFGRPITGWYAFNTNTERYEPWSSIDRAAFDDTSFVWVGEEAGSRHMYPQYDYDGALPVVRSGGAIYDRLNALEVLTDPTTSILAHNADEQMRRFMISYYTAFPREMTELLGSIMVDDHAKFGWCIETNATIGGEYIAARRRDFLGAAAGDCDGASEVPLFPEPKYTFPTTKFRMPALAGLYGMAMMTMDYNNSFLDVSHIYLEGHEDSLTPPEGVEVVRFEDPLSGKVYVAHKTDDTSVYDPAVRLIEEAVIAFEDFVPQDYYLSHLQYIIGKLEIFRGLGRLYSNY